MEHMQQDSDGKVVALREDAPFRDPPHNLEAEQAMLGAILVNNEALGHCRDFMSPTYFFEPVHGRVYESICKLVDQGQIADPVKLKPYFEYDEALADVGGAQYLVRLAASAATIINTQDYARTVRDLAIRRGLIQIGEGLVIDSYNAPVDTSAEALMAELEGQINDYADVTAARVDDAFRGNMTVLESTLKRIDQARTVGVAGLPTGSPALDQILGGLKPSQYVVLGGRPAMGKSALAIIIAAYASRAVTPDLKPAGVLYCSGEMDGEENQLRLLANAIKEGEGRTVAYSDMMRPDFTEADRALLEEYVAPVARNRIMWMDEGVLTPMRVKLRAEQARRQFAKEDAALGLIVVDYLQLMQTDDRTKAGKGRYEEITAISQALRSIAKELKIPLIAISQLSREVDKRQNSRPMLSDLKESGQIEQDANVVLFVFREEEYLKASLPDPTDPTFGEAQAALERARGKMEVIVAKQRGGKTGTVHLLADMAANHFEDDPRFETTPTDDRSDTPDA